MFVLWLLKNDFQNRAFKNLALTFLNVVKPNCKATTIFYKTIPKTTQGLWKVQSEINQLGLVVINFQIF